MSLFDYCRGRVRVICTQPGCNKQVYKGESRTDARLALAHHNWLLHPGVFPRWNPNAEAVETERRGRRLGEADTRDKTADQGGPKPQAP